MVGVRSVFSWLPRHYSVCLCKLQPAACRPAAALSGGAPPLARACQLAVTYSGFMLSLNAFFFLIRHVLLRGHGPFDPPREWQKIQGLWFLAWACTGVGGFLCVPVYVAAVLVGCQGGAAPAVFRAIASLAVQSVNLGGWLCTLVLFCAPFVSRRWSETSTALARLRARSDPEEGMLITLLDGRTMPLQLGLAQLFDSAAAVPDRFAGKIQSLVTGKPEEAARGISFYMGVESAALYDMLSHGVVAIEQATPLSCTS